MSVKTDPRVDTYISDSEPFARPILEHLRKLVHQGCPDIQETIKWSMPFFIAKKNVCFMASFKAHCGFGFWGGDMRIRATRELKSKDEGMGQLGRLASKDDLPSDKVLLSLLQEARAAVDSGQGKYKEKSKSEKKAPLTVPDDLTTAIKKNKAAAKTFTDSSYSHQKEYVEWITEAKRPETRAKRIAQAVTWLAEGKSRNHKYER